MAREGTMRTADDAPFSFSLDLPVRNEWRNVELLRSSVENCFQAVFADLDGRNAVSMVTGELLENALKYGDWDRPGGAQQFRLRVDGGSSKTVVTVQNPVKVDDPGLAELLATIRWIRGHKSPAEAYRARLLEIASAEGDVSKLGLVRVAYEGNCVLDASVTDGTLLVTATMTML
jgi:hypothetical protein